MNIDKKLPLTLILSQWERKGLRASIFPLLEERDRVR
jgi:hypothetical protein